MQRIGVIGGGGQLGRTLLRLLGERGLGWSHEELDVTDPGEVLQKLQSAQLSAVINAAAYTRVDDAEDDAETAVAVNGCGPWNVAVACQTLDLPIVHLSTDYVFGQETGRDVPYREEDAPGPVNVYGASKLYGEYMLNIAARRSFTIRTCGLYGPPLEPGQGNFVETICQRVLAGVPLKVVDDQRCSPTSILEIAPLLIQILDSHCDAYGRYHLTAAGDCTWYEMACAIGKKLGGGVPIERVKSADSLRAAQRPGYSVLDCSRSSQKLGLALPHWRESLENYLDQRSQFVNETGTP